MNGLLRSHHLLGRQYGGYLRVAGALRSAKDLAFTLPVRVSDSQAASEIDRVGIQEEDMCRGARPDSASRRP